jgi:hypothetical protein
MQTNASLRTLAFRSVLAAQNSLRSLSICWSLPAKFPLQYSQLRPTRSMQPSSAHHCDPHA